MTTWVAFGRRLLVPALASTLVCAAAAPAAGQPATLDRVEELTRMGRPEEARRVLMQWWGSARDGSSRQDLQRGLWLRGRLTVDPVQAELDFQRLVVLYPRGPYTAQAIFRLAQAAHAQGDEEAARSHVATLVRDHPGSAVRPEAESWLRAAGPAPPRAERTDPAAGADPDSAAAPDPGRSVPGRAAATEPTPEGASPEGAYCVQLGAFAEEARAMALFGEVSAAGVEVRVVRVEGSRFLHVRFGRFVDRAAAAYELERLREAGISAALVRDERPETVVRD